MRRNDSKLILNMDDPAYEKILFFGPISKFRTLFLFEIFAWAEGIRANLLIYSGLWDLGLECEYDKVIG